MAGTDTEETVTEEVDEAEALRQMEAAFLAGPGGQKDLTVSEPAITDGEETGEAATETATSTETDSQRETVAGESDVETGETPSEVTSEAKSEGLTDDKVLELLKTSQTTEELRAGIKKLRDETFGRVGGLERTLKALQEGLASPGNEADVEEHFAELKEQYPDAAPLIIKGIKQAMKQAKSIAITTGEADPDELVKRILPSIEQSVGQKFEQQFIARTLDREHKGWRDIVGAPDSKTEFRVWLEGKPEEERTHILGSYDVDLLSTVLTEFKESKKTKAKPQTPAPTNRASRLAEAVTPKGNINPPAPRKKTAEEEMEDGFKEGPGGRR